VSNQFLPKDTVNVLNLKLIYDKLGNKSFVSMKEFTELFDGLLLYNF